MKLIDKERKFPPFDVASGQAVALLATGTVEEYKPPTVEIKHICNFAVREGDRIEDYRCPPKIVWSCSVCGNGSIEGPTAHKQKLYHRAPYGFAQEVPADVATTFIGSLRAWQKLHGKRHVNRDLAAAAALLPGFFKK
jgi:hypothetical protein